MFFFLREQLDLFRCNVCDWVILSENNVRCSIFERAIVPNRSETVRRGKALSIANHQISCCIFDSHEYGVYILKYMET
jgi:hypothetical protein